MTMSEPHEATIGGHLVDILGRVPEVGEVIDLGGSRTEGSDIDDTRITHPRIQPPQP
jgi:CBS domain containing-hemolysin-like protein